MWYSVAPTLSSTVVYYRVPVVLVGARCLFSSVVSIVYPLFVGARGERDVELLVTPTRHFEQFGFQLVRKLTKGDTGEVGLSGPIAHVAFKFMIGPVGGDVGVTLEGVEGVKALGVGEDTHGL